MRPIDADALMDVLVAVMDDYRANGEILKAKATMCAIKCLESKVVSPTLDLAPIVHGKWIMVSSDGAFVVCNACNRSDHIDPLATHCRYCGAKMDGGKKDV